MLAYIRKGIMSGKTAASYLGSPDIKNYKWLTRNKDESAGYLCDKEIELTEELRTYLLYFSFATGKNITPSLTQFSNIPIKEV